MRYIKDNKTINVWLPNKLFTELKCKIEERNKIVVSPKLQLAQASYLLNLVIYLPIKYKDKYEDEWIPICSQAHKNFKHFSKYINFLVENGLLIKNEKNYSTVTKECKKFALPFKYRNQLISHTVVKGHAKFIEARKEIGVERMRKADENTSHLTKWLKPEYFEFNYEEAKEYVNSKYGKEQLAKHNSRILILDIIQKQDWGYSREGKDNRLHSVITSLPKDLRPFLSFKGNSLISLDINNSQPFVFCAMLNTLNTKPHLFYEGGRERMIDRILATTNMPNMFDLNDQVPFNKGLQRFVDEVVSGMFYEKYGGVLYQEDILLVNNSGRYFFMEYQSKKNSLICRKYNTLREAAKHITMKTLFCSKLYKQAIITVFKKYYPEVYKVMQAFKRPNDRAYFPILLQNIEADCILDYCTHNIAERFPEIPLITIHDSIITTENNIEIVEREFRKHLHNYFGLMPKLQREYWTKLKEAV